MEQDFAKPVNHSGLSAFSTKSAGTAGGALKYGMGSAGAWILGLTVIGVIVGVTIATAGIGTPAAAGALSTIGTGILNFATSGIVWGAVIGGGLGAWLGLGSAWLPGGVGALVGGAKGHSKASARVENERMAAAGMQAEIASMRAQAVTQAPQYAPQQRFQPLIPTGSQYNQAGSTLSSVQGEGLMSQQQLQRG